MMHEPKVAVWVFLVIMVMMGTMWYFGELTPLP